jgi:ABC-type multidrug transport system fused ATPase/permease subunit
MSLKQMLDIICKKCNNIKGLPEILKLLPTNEDKDDIIDKKVKSDHFNKISEIINEQCNNLKSLIDPEIETDTDTDSKYIIDVHNVLDKDLFITTLREIIKFLDLKNSPLILTLKKMLDDNNNKDNQVIYGLTRFIGYDIEDNFEFVSLMIISILLLNAQYNNLKQKSNIFNGLINLFISVNQTKLTVFLKKKKLNMTKIYLITDFKIIQENINKKIKNGDKNEIYNSILGEYYVNNIDLHQKYYSVIQTIAYESVILLQLILPSSNNFNYNLFDYTFLFIFIYFVIFTQINYIQSKHNIISLSDYHLYKKKIINIIADIINNYNIINETNTYTRMSDKLIENIENFIDEMYKTNLGLDALINIDRRKMRNKIIWARYVLLIFTPYNISMGYDLDYFCDIFERLIDDFANLEILIINNIVYEDILHYKCEEQNEDKLFLDDAEILYKIEDMSHKFGENIIFKNVNIIIPKNKWICFYGNSGCGKTTLCNILLRNLIPDSGVISYLNQFPDYNYNNIRESISFLNTDTDIFDATVLYNITYGLENPEDTIILEKIDWYAKMFEFDTEKLQMNANTLSTGEKQRIKIIRLILHDKPIWILDEITSNINNDLEHKILQELRRIKNDKNKTVIHITHNLENICFSDVKMYIKHNNIFSVLNTKMTD